MNTEELNYELPEELIAQEPATPRDSSRLMTISRRTGCLEHHRFWELPQWLNQGDVLVINTSRVIPSRLVLDDNRIILLLRKGLEEVWEALGEKGSFQEGDEFSIEERFTGKVVSQREKVGPNGEALLQVVLDDRILLQKRGHIPLPPYIHSYHGDLERYQTVYAKEEGSAAAPTAGFHFTPELLQKCREKGVGLAEVVLHISIDTFLPIPEDNPLEHRIHKEWIQVSEKVAQQIASAKRVICVGTTACRTVEQMWSWKGKPSPCEGFADMYITPGYQFHISGLITNFHYPRSTMLLLVMAFLGRGDWMWEAYRTAIQEKYRFFSFGDAMLIL